jgi:hypothetical protein
MKLPAINPDRPKIAVRRLVQFQQCTFLTWQQNIQVDTLKHSIRGYERNRGTESAKGALAHVQQELSKLEAML